MILFGTNPTKTNICVCLIVLVTFVGCKVHQPELVSHLDYDQEYTAEQILNNDFPKRRPSPKIDVVYDTTGFVKERLFHVPEVGEHPRILFASSDIPRIKKQLRKSKSGQQVLRHVIKEIAKGIDKPGTREYEIFEACRKKDFVRIEKSWSNPGLVDGSKWHHRDAFRVSLMLKAWLALINDDIIEGEKVAEALTGYAEYLAPMMDAVNKDPDNNVWWKYGHKLFGWLNAAIPLTYDWNYNYMNSDQRSTVRSLLSKITYGKYNLGMELPAHWANWNHIGGEMYFPLYALAIEGEEGYDDRIYKRSVDVARSFLDYGISKKGMSKESVGYHSGGMTHLSIFMVAAANRGDVLFTHPHYRNQIDWYLYRLQPYGGEWVSRGDVGFSEPSTEPLMVHKYFYPQDAKVDYVFRNLRANRVNLQTSDNADTVDRGNETALKGNYMKDYFMELMLLCTEDPTQDRDENFIEYDFGKALNLTNSFFDKERGSMSTKTGWGKWETQLQFDARTDTRFASHDHPDRGSFDLAALGRLWTREDSRLISSSDHSVILIDGIGQGYFPSFSRWIGFFDTEEVTVGVSDLKYAYDWQWQKEMNMWNLDDPRLDKPYFHWIRDKLLSFDKQGWEYDTSPEVEAYYKGYLDGNPLMWHGEDSWIIRKSYNPVKRAFRTAGLVRGDHPYVLIADDIQKDGNVHLYEWLMALPKDIYIEDMTLRVGHEQDIILREEQGNRRLLVRILDCEGLDETAMNIYDPKHGNYTQVRRLSIRARAVAPNFKILLYPMLGSEKPVTSWNDDRSVLDIRFESQNDEFRFDKNADGRTIFSVYRENQKIIDTGSLDYSQED